MKIDKPKISIFDSWLWKMAWRDSRSHRRRLLLFMSAIVLGVAALVAISSFGESLEEAINGQAKGLLGADMRISSRAAFSPELEAQIDSLGGLQSREASFGSMAYFPKNQQTRLVQVRALSGGFPYYGSLDTSPANAIDIFRTDGGALIDYGLMLQFDLQPGDSLKLGQKTFPILGQLDKIPGVADAGMAMAPTIFIPKADVEATGLVQFGSRVSHRVHFKFPENTNADDLADKLEKQFRDDRIRVSTVESRKENFGEAMQNLYRFLNLVAFIALLLGSIGVASAIHVYIRQKLATIAVLRCVGSQIKQTFYIYLIQAAVLGLIGSICGVLLGIGIELYLPELLKDFLAFDVEFIISSTAIVKGLLIGMGTTILFALLPLISVRKVSPLLAIRASFEADGREQKDAARWLLYLAIAVSILLFAIAQMEFWWQGVLFVLGLGIAFGFLAGTAKLLMMLIKRYFPRSWNYIWRQSLANLYRPNNQTLVLMLSLGLGVFLISNLFLTQESLLQQVAQTDSNNQPNMILFDIQNDQQEAVKSLIESHDLPVMQTVPLVTLRLQNINGRSVTEMRDDTTISVPGWALVREYRVTYRDTLTDTESILEGEWIGATDPAADTIMISLEEGIARNLEVKLGDHITVDVQGIPIPTKIASIRKVNWQRMQPNFFVVFPKGILDDAPQIHVMVTRAQDAETAAQLQRELVQQFPNISAIDLSLILETVESLLGKITFIIRFMAMFSILTGLLVLAAAIITSRFQRIQESVLLRTLGAKRRQVSRIMALEYLYLGGFAGLTGILLSVLSSWAISVFLFRTAFHISIFPLFLTWIGVMLLTLALGMFNSRGITTRPPLEVLRSEI